MTSETGLPRKAVIALGFTIGSEVPCVAPALLRGALAEPLPAAARHSIQLAVEEALAAGLSEFIFIAADGQAAADVPPMRANDNRRPQVVIARHGAAATLERALCGARKLIDGEPFVVIAPQSGAASRRGAVSRLLEAYRRAGGNIVTVKEAETLRLRGSFATIESEPAGHYLLQPDVLDALAADPGVGLAATLLAQAEVWPVTALPLLFARPLGETPGIPAAAAAE